MDGWTNGRTDKVKYRVACPQLEKNACVWTKKATERKRAKFFFSGKTIKSKLSKTDRNDTCARGVREHRVSFQ